MRRLFNPEVPGGRRGKARPEGETGACTAGPYLRNRQGASPDRPGERAGQAL
ncbi:MAG TPA: hypothetical protein VKA14_09910 [Gammaproteobacteria bacterium]|nr:hypothetical protein [Gammaproteobacteria bacterium]